MRTFSVKNFERFQHYTDRTPPWIKLYNELLEDYEFAKLDDTIKAHLVLIWLLASRMDNKLPYDAAWIAGKINARSPVDLDAMAAAGFIVEWNHETARGKREDWPSRYISAETRAFVLERDGNKCVRCPSGTHLEIDHIVPVSKGGRGTPDNLQTLCRSCNRKKRAELSYAGAEQVATQTTQSAEPRERDRERGREEKESPPKAPRKRVVVDELDFVSFWEAYPHKVGKPAARRAFQVASGRADIATMLAGLERYKRAKPLDQRWLNPATFLNQDRWADEPASVSEVNGRQHLSAPRKADFWEVSKPEPPTGPPPPLERDRV